MTVVTPRAGAARQDRTGHWTHNGSEAVASIATASEWDEPLVEGAREVVRHIPPYVEGLRPGAGGFLSVYQAFALPSPRRLKRSLRTVAQ
ncbi:hypothetical protein GCM10010411_34200 [Actinomadura fulvescens]|uniref:Uncharacterized protein n=1 Tax=Actinomadura fulvescens TaxID=46160 RepID=A0ABN3PS48_9ACTN